jgi:hypothetical protein
LQTITQSPATFAAQANQGDERNKLGIWAFVDGRLTCDYKAIGLVKVWFRSLEIIASLKDADHVDQAYKRFQAGG